MAVDIFGATKYESMASSMTKTCYLSLRYMAGGRMSKSLLKSKKTGYCCNQFRLYSQTEIIIESED